MISAIMFLIYGAIVSLAVLLVGSILIGVYFQKKQEYIGELARNLGNAFQQASEQMSKSDGKNAKD